MSWLALRDQHGDALGSLQPRFVPPRNGNGPYRLVAGPLPSKADADKVCAEMGLGPRQAASPPPRSASRCRLPRGSDPLA